jgi:pimeloyl-ACP methyl ester carboxylesterase
MLRSLPVWQARVVAAHTIAEEMIAGERFKFIPGRFRGLNLPTLLLLGGDGPPFQKQATELVHAMLPNSRIAIMPGQQQTAMNTAPQLFASEVLRFLLE